ncbi:MAG: type II toxin-antitoxin system RelE/ParE family toxin [Acidobacteriota bacterium]
MACYSEGLTPVKRRLTIRILRIRSFSHKPLKRFYAEGVAKGLPADAGSKLRAMFAVLDHLKDVEELKSWPLWRVHSLTGDRIGTCLHVTRNWRLTFRIESGECWMST